MMGDLLPRPGDPAVTVMQPWADCMLFGGKPVENRTKPWPSTRELPCRLWLHTSKKRPTSDRVARAHDLLDLGQEDKLGLLASSADRLGVIVGRIVMARCHHADECADYCGHPGSRVGYCEHCGITKDTYCSRWAEPDRWHLVIAEPEPLDVPVPVRGALGIWRLPEGVGADA